MPKLQLLVQQGDSIVTVDSNSTPVLSLEMGDSHLLAQHIVNFLRSGCPSVQVIHDSSPPHEDKVEEILDVLHTLALPGEKFDSYCDPGPILRVVRTVDEEE